MVSLSVLRTNASRSTGGWVFRGAWFEDDDRYRPFGPGLVGVEVGINLDEPGPELLTLLLVRGSCPDRDAALPDLDRRFRVHDQVAIPLRIPGKTALGRHHDGVRPISHVQQRGRVLATGFTAAMVEQQRRDGFAETGADTPPTTDATTGTPIDPDVDTRGDAEDLR